MSSSAECWEFSGRKLPEKPSFSQTCSRLSRYLKEKGSFGDLSLGMTCKPEVNGGGVVGGVSRQPTMMNLFPCEAAAGIDSSASQDVKPKTMVPRQSSFSSSSSSGAKEQQVDMMIIDTKSVKSEPQSAPLTIFYGGQVMVFDDFPADKAKQVIDLANKASPKTFITPELNNNQITYTQSLVKNQKEIASTTPNPVPSPVKTLVAQEPIQTNTSSLACELPIARRASLHRFLAKRKDRITSKAPYQIDGSTEASSKPNTAWPGSQ